MKKLTFAASVLAAVVASAQAQATTIEFTHFFGDCRDQWGQNTDLNKATGQGECAVITTMVNKFNAKNDDGHTVNLRSLPWLGYYDSLKAGYASSNVPDIAVMHSAYMPGFTRRRLLTDLTEPFEQASIDTSDFTEQASAMTQDNDKYYALPFDSHGLLWHLNLDLFEQAGLIGDHGEPILPSSPEEWQQHAKQMKEKTGKDYFTASLRSADHPAWIWRSLVGQQGASYISEDGRKAQLDTPEGLEALKLINSLIDNGHAKRHAEYDVSEQDFINGEVAVQINGTWVVDEYQRQAKSDDTALQRHGAYTFPTIYEKPAVFQGNHVWVMPRNDRRTEEQQAAAMEFMAFLYEHNLDWARTGHLPVRQSVLQSDEYLRFPQRENYATTASVAMSVPPVSNAQGFDESLLAELQPVWQNNRDEKEALQRAERSVSRVMNR